MGSFFKIKAISVIASVFIIIFTGCDNRENKAEVKELNKSEKIRLGLAMQPSSGLAIIALENGYFKKNGLDIKILEFPSGKRALNDGLFKGKVDIATSSDVPIAISMLKGLKFNVAAITFKADNINRIIARKDAGIYKPTDLVGKRIATQKSSAVHFFLHLFIGEYGIDYKDVEISYMKAEKLPSALASGEIDAFSMREPYITQAKKLLGDNYIIFSEPGLYSQVDAIVVDKNIIQNSPNTVNNFIRALIEAEKFTTTNTQKAIAIIAKKLRVSHESIAKLWPEVKLTINLGQSYVILMEDIARWAILEKLTKEKHVPNSLEYIYFKGLDNIKPESITIVR